MNMKKLKIIACIPTKNRSTFFEKALNSVLNQTHLPDEILIISDSDDKHFKREQVICSARRHINLSIFKTQDKAFARNYAGSLNYALLKYVGVNNTQIDQFEQTYFAFLDDDDTWHENYLEQCVNSIRNNEDFVVTGLNFIKEDATYKLTIPDVLTVESFLVKNPHLQGSNTFVKLSTLLKAGGFDENLDSMVDRDFFIRLMFLNPKYVVVNKHLVNVDAADRRQRITNNKVKKIAALKKFLYKYENLMSPLVKSGFFANAAKLFSISQTEVENHQLEFRTYPPRALTSVTNPKLLNLTFGIIITEYELALRLVQQIIGLQLPKCKLILIRNFTNKPNKLKTLLSSHGDRIDFYFVDFADIAKVPKEIIPKSEYPLPKIKSIATSRTILNHYLKIHSLDGPIWIIDDDMEFYEYVNNGTSLIKAPLDISGILNQYQSYDVVIGSYSQDPPLPLLATLRTGLVDYFYHKKLKWKSEHSLRLMAEDYYYDLSDLTQNYLETPFSYSNQCKTIDTLFSGKSCSRPLFNFRNDIVEAKCRGGNTLIFNKKVLDYPNWSIAIDDLVARRSDYFWTLILKRRGFKVICAPFSLLHNRPLRQFDIAKEETKLLQDFMGSALTKTVEKNPDAFYHDDFELDSFVQDYQQEFAKRLAKYVISYYRINGLLGCLNHSKYHQQFTIDRLKRFVITAQNRVDQKAVEHAILTLRRQLNIYNNHLKRDAFKSQMEQILQTQLHFLGIGSEGIVFHDNEFVYKCYYKPFSDQTNLLELLDVLKNSKFFYAIELLKINDVNVIKYKYEKAQKLKFPIKQMQEMLYFLIKNNIYYDNFKPDNFIRANNTLKVIDYGKSIQRIENDSQKDRMVRRAFELIEYSALSDDDFKKLIRNWWANVELRDGIDFKYASLDKLVQKRSKELIHDPMIVDLVVRHRSKQILDYGAGKCRIANNLRSQFGKDVYVFDVDLNSLKQNTKDHSKIITNVRTNKLKFDTIVCNLVLCCVDDDTLEQILTDFKNNTKENAHIILSICNPFFNYVKESEIATKIIGKQFDYFKSVPISKTINCNGKKRTDFHRPISFYLAAFKRYGFHVAEVKATEGVNLANLNPIADFLTFDLTYKPSQMIINQPKSIVIAIQKNDNMQNEDLNQILISLKQQQVQNFEIHFISEDHSPVAEYARFLFEYDSYFRGIGKLVVTSSIMDYLTNHIEPSKYILFIEQYKLLINAKTTEVIGKLVSDKNELVLFNYLNHQKPWLTNNLSELPNFKQIYLKDIPFLTKAIHLRNLHNQENVKILNKIFANKLIEVVLQTAGKLHFETKQLFLLKPVD